MAIVCVRIVQDARASQNNIAIRIKAMCSDTQERAPTWWSNIPFRSRELTTIVILPRIFPMIFVELLPPSIALRIFPLIFFFFF
ncbi:hypothetical protein BJ508DRAFT_165171 [Ascobolus immersus RN42]|uniref:Uncharacterized protein n=1 Tax=Ascobolus immersus RN42 TaxID=1160509 RepID=A0A3N4HV03_ASCIM|nr:hypothetical protein BJ508DRAFT_165171 [Ascobolus immersus RN42]